MTTEIDLKRIEDTWAEVGYRARPLRDLVFVRTELLPEKEGLIFIPPSERTNYARLGNQVFMRALVLDVGPDCKLVKKGMRIAYTRLFFAWLWKLEDKTLVGYLREDNVSAEDLIDYSASG